MSQQLDAEPPPPVTVTIFDQPYRLRSGRGDEHLRRVAAVVDERMREVATHMRSLDVTRIAVLAALNLADELESLRADQSRDDRPRDERAHDRPSDDARADAGHPRGQHAHGEQAHDGRDYGAAARGERAYDERAAPPGGSAPADLRTGGARAGDPDAGGARRSWFEEIFEAEDDTVRDGERRLSNEISSKLRPRRRD